MKKRFKVISKVRFFLFIITMSAMLTILVVSLLSNNKVYGSSYGFDYNYNEVRVVKGDTLWVIALESMPEGYDVREMIYKIKRLNEMDLSNIYAGDIIKVPIIED